MDGSIIAPIAAESGSRKTAPYLFLGQTTSLCETCLALVPAKIIAEGERVYYQKRCREHGVQKTLIADDLGYWKAQKDWLKPGDRPLAVQTRTDHGCPTTAACARTTSSIPAWRSWRSTRLAT
jgi:uncharacterized radical SAM superfamily Fe-S cluster-containing enzyme